MSWMVADTAEGQTFLDPKSVESMVLKPIRSADTLVTWVRIRTTSGQEYILKFGDRDEAVKFIKAWGGVGKPIGIR
jgi:hypothetical protein